MTVINLTFSDAAAKALGANTRLRVKSLTRAGVEYVALRPSYRVSGKNAQIRAVKNEADGTISAELPDELISALALPELKKDTKYLFEEVSAKYGWFILKPTEEEIKAKASAITVTRVRKSAKKAEADTAETTPAETPATPEAAA